ncbi:hypothetical protein Tco_0532144 [Tanacetum coccineum]
MDFLNLGPAEDSLSLSKWGKQMSLRAKGITDRVKNRKESSLKVLKLSTKRKNVALTSSARITRQRTSKPSKKDEKAKVEYLEPLEVSDGNTPDLQGFIGTKGIPITITCYLSYTRKAVLDNTFNQRTKELLKTIKQAREAIDVMLKMEKAKDSSYNDLKEKFMYDHLDNTHIHRTEARLRPFRGYFITLYTNGQLCTRVTVTLVSRAEGNGYSEKDEKQSQKRQNWARNGKVCEDKAKPKPKSQSSQKVNRKVKQSKSKGSQNQKKYNLRDQKCQIPKCITRRKDYKG